VQVVRPRRSSWGRKPRPILAGLFGVVGLWLAVGFVSDGLARAVSDDPRWALLVPVGAVLAVVAVLNTVRTWTDAFNRSVVQGRVIDRYYNEGYSGGEGPSTPAEHWLAVDDGSSDTVRAHRVDYGVFRHVMTGDEVRMTVGPHRGHVWDVEIVATSHGALGPTGSVGSLGLNGVSEAAARAAGMPVPPEDMATLTGRIVRAVEGPAPPAGPGGSAGTDDLSTWTYHLGWSVNDEPNRRDLYVDVHLATGSGGFEAVLGQVSGSGDGPGDKVEGLGDLARRYGHLLVARQGELTVAIDPVPGVWLRSPVPKPWSFGRRSPKADEVLARLALQHGAAPTR
jgi:hypothetical protein